MEFQGEFYGDPGEFLEVGKVLIKQTLNPDIRIGARVKSLELKQSDLNTGNYKYSAIVDQFVEVLRDGVWVQTTPSKPTQATIEWNLFDLNCRIN